MSYFFVVKTRMFIKNIHIFLLICIFFKRFYTINIPHKVLFKRGRKFDWIKEEE